MSRSKKANEGSPNKTNYEIENITSSKDICLQEIQLKKDELELAKQTRAHLLDQQRQDREDAREERDFQRQNAREEKIEQQRQALEDKLDRQRERAEDQARQDSALAATLAHQAQIAENDITARRATDAATVLRHQASEISAAARAMAAADKPSTEQTAFAQSLRATAGVYETATNIRAAGTTGTINPILGGAALPGKPHKPHFLDHVSAALRVDDRHDFPKGDALPSVTITDIALLNFHGTKASLELFRSPSTKGAALSIDIILQSLYNYAVFAVRLYGNTFARAIAALRAQAHELTLTRALLSPVILLELLHRRLDSLRMDGIVSPPSVDPFNPAADEVDERLLHRTAQISAALDLTSESADVVLKLATATEQRLIYIDKAMADMKATNSKVHASTAGAEKSGAPAIRKEGRGKAQPAASPAASTASPFRGVVNSGSKVDYAALKDCPTIDKLEVPKRPCWMWAKNTPGPGCAKPDCTRLHEWPAGVNEAEKGHYRAWVQAALDASRGTRA